jgi:ubiquinone/menaquinone biosynthesis C-methylase UbiE
VKRVPSLELLDSDAGTPAEIFASLADLRRINQSFGGIATTKSMIRRVAARVGTNSFSLLEVASGTGYVPGQVRDQLKSEGVELQITLLDRAVSHFAVGDVKSHLRCVAADALSLPFADSSFDLVSCCLFAHHLDPALLKHFVSEGLRVCRRVVIINDLVRSPVHLALVRAATPFFGSRITRNDAPASVRQSYTPQEICRIVGQTTATMIEVQRHYFYRMGIIAWKELANV